MNLKAIAISALATGLASVPVIADDHTPEREHTDALRFHEGIPADNDEAERPSYTSSWESPDGYKHRSIMFPHAVDGCKVMIQSIQPNGQTGTAGLTEAEGLDCDCDLVIDGKENTFRPDTDWYTSRRLREVCEGDSVDALTRKRFLVRESLKQIRDFSQFENVDGF